MFKPHNWRRDPLNPVLPPGPNWFDAGCCMNPCVQRVGDHYYLFYGGGGNDGKRRICLAIAPVDNITNWRRLGPILDNGGPDSFDAVWCVLPTVHKINGKWHLYYTGFSGKPGLGLQAFYGMGLAVSDDLIHWKKYSDDYILTGDGFPQFPTNRGIAGAGNILEIPQPDGRILYRMYYTAAVGIAHPDMVINQEKHAVVAHSYDGIHWFDKRVVLSPRKECGYEDVACIGLNVWHTGKRYRCIYAGIGTKFGWYSLCEAVSDDGLNWERGLPGENLALPPSGTGWEKQMTEYPHVWKENGRLRLLYCGNGYGGTGIGTATAEMME